jgi:hypothetical protein
MVTGAQVDVLKEAPVCVVAEHQMARSASEPRSGMPLHAVVEDADASVRMLCVLLVGATIWWLAIGCGVTWWLLRG